MRFPSPIDGGPDRGRQARQVSEIPAPGWKDILWRTAERFVRDNLEIVARGIAFSAVIALFPALAAFVALYGLFADPATAREQLALLTGIVPAGTLTLIGDEMVRITVQAKASLSLTFAASLVLALWSINTGMRALFRGLNIAYLEQEKRSFLRLNLESLAFTLGGFVFLLATAGAVLVAPVVLQFFQIRGVPLPLAWVRWPALFVLALAGLALLYRFGPSRARPRWRWVTWGALVAAALWLVSSLLLSWYITYIADYSATYGSLGAVFGFLTWSWLSAVIVLFGAKLNAEIEHQTMVDSTTGPEAPFGRRGAVVADTRGRARRGALVDLAPLVRLWRRLVRGRRQD